MFAVRSSQASRSPLSHAITEVLESRQMLAAGGGWTAGGLVGEYFNNTAFTAPSAFTRRDVRVDFDWTNVGRPGGSSAPGYNTIGADNYSIRWTGQLIAKYTETYTFKVNADDIFKLEVKPAGGSTWTTVINQTAYTGSTVSGTYALTAGSKYDVRIEYKELTGNASAKLRWSSPSTPEETIDTSTEIGFNVEGSWGQAFTDIIKEARAGWEAPSGGTKPAMDATGWPMGDGDYVWQESNNQGLGLDPLERGTISFSFTGRADVSIWGNVDTPTLTYSYNSTNNTTSGSFKSKDNNINASYFRFRNTDRDGNYGADGIADKDGITNLKLMKPTAPDATTSYASTSLFLPQMRDALMNHFTSLRVNLNNGNQESQWSDRTLPTFFNQAHGRDLPRLYSTGSNKGSGASWEYKIMLANETGRDLYINIPMAATGWTVNDTTSYVYKLAQLIKYGSDANGNVYTSTQANPAYPPLNPNLRVYIELSNEYWNSYSDAFRQYWDLDAMVAASVDEYLTGSSTDPRARGEDYGVFNYDNLPTTKNTSGQYNSLGTWRKRFILMREIQISNIFRGVFGDTQMPGTSTNPRIRPLYMWQYENANNTAIDAMQFAENYYNNGDGISHVTTPRPLNYYIWGGGGATYYGSLNQWGTTDQMGNPSFETPALANGYNQAPANSGWTFTGTAGIARDAGTTDDIPTPDEGVQAGYIAGTGKISRSFTLPATHTSNVYAISFKAVQQGTDTQKFKVFVDGVDVSAKSASQSGGYQPAQWDSTNKWKANTVWWVRSDYFQTLTFTGAPGSTHTVSFEGLGAADQVAFLEDVRLSSVDAIFAGSMPASGSFANGQTGAAAYQDRLKNQAQWAAAYGLVYTTYEGGWALGGDTGGSPLQNHAKYNDTRARDVNLTALQMFSKAGGHLNTLGTYAQWPSWSDFTKQEGLLNLASFPLIQGQDSYLGTLPNAVENGTVLTSSLTQTVADKEIDYKNTNGTLATNGWISWNVVANTAGTYNIGVDAGAGGTMQILVDGKVVDSYASGDALTHAPTNVTLSRGMHSIRVKALSGSFVVTNVTIKSGTGALAGPALAVYDGQGMLQSDTQMAADSVASGVTVSSAAFGPGLKATNNSAFKNGLVFSPSDNNDPTDFAGAQAGNDYVYFTVAPASGKKMSLNKLSLNLWRQSGGMGVGVRYSTDGTNFTTVGEQTLTGTPAGMTDFSLSGFAALQNTTATVTFRVYFWNYGDYGSGAIGNKSGNDLVVYGSLANATVGSTTIQAESATIGGGAAVATNNAGYNGTGFVDFNATGGYNEFTYNAATAGSYTLTFRYANGGTTGRNVELKLNGTTQTGVVTFAPSGSWTTWTTVSITVTLVAGNNTIRLTSIGQDGPNLDELVIAPV